MRFDRKQVRMRALRVNYSCRLRARKVLTLAKKQVRKVLWTWKGVRAKVVTAGRCMHAELTSGMLWLAVATVACTPGSMIVKLLIIK